ncbi:hypothetical protein EJ110_NYTH41801 [Nymphaea thermarum]|nr:hypothetical protein EJ110_NYTH41801 [Nymphaea thermarum]
MAEGGESKADEKAPQKEKESDSSSSTTTTTKGKMADKDERPLHLLGQLVCAFLMALLLLLGITALVVWLVYRPHRPGFNVQAAAVYALNTSGQTTITTSMQFTVAVRNPNKRSDAEYRDLSAFVTYRNQVITVPTPLPDLHQARKSTVIMSPVLAGDYVPISPEVASGLAMAEAYGLASMRWVLQGKLRWKSGVFKGRFNGLYVKCDVVVGLKSGMNGPVPLLGSPDCNVEA